jgi:tetratricopeptide (TPR) repeat protein
MNHRASRTRSCALAAAVVAVAMLSLAAGLRSQENLGRGRVAGKVLDERKQPVEGARVVAQCLTALGTKLDARTDHKGGFVIGGMGTGPWRFTAAKAGYREAVLDLDVHQLRANPSIVLILKDVAAAAPVEEEPRKDAEDALDRGNRLLAEERYAEARELLERFLGTHPDAYQVRLQIGQCGLKLGELERAEGDLKALLDEILKRAGSYGQEAALASQALAGLGEAAVKRNDIEAGMAYFRQALEISPASETVAYNVAEILFANQKTDEAIQYYLMAVGIRKDWAKPYNKLGIAYLNKGDYAKALEYLRKSVAVDPDSPAAAEARNIIAAIEKIK